MILGPDPNDAPRRAPMADPSDHWQRLRVSAVQPRLWLELAIDYQRHDLPWQAGYAARQALRCDPGLRPELDALGPASWHEASSGDGQLGRATLPQAAALIKQFSARTRACPNDWLTWLYLARLHDMALFGLPSNAQGSSPAREPALTQAMALEVLPGESLHWLGVWRLNAGDAEGAVSAFSGLLDLRPLRHGSMMSLGEALLRSGQIAAAEKAFSRASLSANPDFLLTLANRVYVHNYWQEAIAVLKKALALRPQHVPTWLALARIQHEVYALADCRQSLERLKVLAPEHPEAVLLDIGLHGRMGDARAHRAALQAAYARGDPLSRLASSVAMTALYDDRLAASEVAALHRRLCAPIEASVVEKTAFPNARSTRRRLRIGYVTGDLHRQHPVNLFMLPVLLRHDRRRFEVCLYHTGSMFDAYTRRARDAADRWCEAARLDDQALQQAILADEIDLLVDLAGHTASHRLGLFALRAAPVQATFLGYPHSTGLSRIDWLIGDATVAPAAHAELFSEGLAQMPASVFCWAPVDDYPLPRPRPAAAAVVFASFNNAMKLSPPTVALWAQVLQAVPGSTLWLKAPSLQDASVQARFRERFAAHGIAADRLELRGPSGLAEMMQEYGAVDIALDPTPYNGGTTTLQALWMGVPVITLAGDNFVGRMGASFLNTLGQADWVAADEAGYVAAAARLANTCSDWRGQRGHLRERLAASPLCDIATWVGDLEALYERMWADWCNGSRQRLLPVRRRKATSDAGNPGA
jgi:protein O-GlcNAc transferase